jgi:hypothetical protein
MKPIRVLHLEAYATKKKFSIYLSNRKKKLCFFPLFLHKNKTQTSSIFQRLLKELFYSTLTDKKSMRNVKKKRFLPRIVIFLFNEYVVCA